jgi:1,4-dihydroxy-2-naphthoyl-CoA synthase
MFLKAVRRSVPLSHNLRYFSAAYTNIKVTRHEESISLIELNRPKALNALCDALF